MENEIGCHVDADCPQSVRWVVIDQDDPYTQLPACSDHAQECANMGDRVFPYERGDS